jgi:hypothetical protein
LTRKSKTLEASVTTKARNDKGSTYLSATDPLSATLTPLQSVAMLE